MNRIPLFHGKKETEYIVYPRNEKDQRECKRAYIYFLL